MFKVARNELEFQQTRQPSLYHCPFIIQLSMNFILVKISYTPNGLRIDLRLGITQNGNDFIGVIEGSFGCGSGENCKTRTLDLF